MKLFSQIATTLLGLLVGGMLLIALGLVPYWRALDPADFTTAFAASLPTVAGTMILLTISATASILIAAGLAIWKKLPTRNWLVMGAACAIAMFITVPIYFASANPLLAGGTLSALEIGAELKTWQQMQWFRTIIGIVGLFCAVRAGYTQTHKTEKE